MDADDTAGAAFRYSWGKLALGALGSFAFAAMCGWIAYGGLAAPGSFKEAVMWFGAAFFGLGGVLCLRNAFDRRAILTISPAGIRDLRISPDFIPWNAILGLSLSGLGRQQFFTLEMDPGAVKAIRLSRMARWSGPMNAKLGFSGLVLNPRGLDGSLVDLIQALMRFQPKQE